MRRARELRARRAAQDTWHRRGADRDRSTGVHAGARSGGDDRADERAGGRSARHQWRLGRRDLVLDHQEPGQGVDEPDIVKTDGSTIFSLQGDTVRAVDVTGSAPKLAGSLALPSNESASGLLLDGNRLIVVGQSSPRPVPLGMGSRSDHAHDVGRRQLRRRPPERLVGTVRDRVDPAAIAYPAQATAARSWVPARRFRSLVTHRRYTVPVAHCNAIRRPAQFSGLGIVTILTVDLSKGLFATDSTAIMANPQIVYGSATSLYLATERWINPATHTRACPSQTAP